MGGFKIGERMLGPGHPPLLLPDIGTFFNQDLAAAFRLVDGLQAAGAELIKGELLHDPDVCLDDQTFETYYAPNRRHTVSERYRALIERKVLPLSKYEELFSECNRRQLSFVVSVYDFVGADFAYDLKAAALKIATSNVVHEPLIRYVARMGLPMIIDTGRSTMAEVTRAVGWAREEGELKLIVEHSPPPPPTEIDQQNLRVLDVLSNTFDCLVGLSDHHAGPEMMYAAAALNASVLEKGVYPDGTSDDQDVAHAIPVSQFAEVLRTCNTIFRGLGCPQLPPVQQKKLSRMGLVAKRELAEGELITLDTAGFAFPAKGIGVEHWGIIEGWRVRRALPPGTPITWRDVEPLAA
ncbi:N-acetylneuraminate synthase family protein [Pelagibius sp.]|uniref:N-acetylneuraminate synthase family protein n=1 Tax=Pelagibius sp. TaxID=1931238 RepID=UPI003B501CD7